MKTQLKDRILWFDGTNQVNPDDVPGLILSGCSLDKIVVDELNDDLKLFNLIEEVQIKTEKKNNDDFDKSWVIPERYQKLDIEEYLFEQSVEFYYTKSIDKEMRTKYDKRLEEEMKEIKSRNLEILLRTLVYIVDTFKQSKTVWGVGRGSSCASLVLFLIGLHKVDPIKYNIPMTEFFH